MKNLSERREKCLDMLMLHEPDPYKNPWNFFKLSYPANEKIPYVVDCIELQKSKSFGRHLITNRALKTGNIICIEEPFHKFINNSARFSHCANCLKSEKLNLFPCLECDCSECYHESFSLHQIFILFKLLVMFCSKPCMTAADPFHKIQCQLVYIDIEAEDQIFEVAYRQVFEALSVFKKIEKLAKFYEDHTESKTVFDFNFIKSNDLRDVQNMLQSVNSLQKNKIPDEMGPIMDRHVELMKSITKNPKNQIFLDWFMRKQMEIIVTNSFAISSKHGSVTGTGISPLSSFFNHSCAPNIVRINVDSRLVFVVSRPIEKNKQLFVCYRDNFLETAKSDRQKSLQKSYNFRCSCEACIKNYPTIDKLVRDEEPLDIQFSDIAFVDEAVDRLGKNCNYIDRRAKNFPSYNVCMAMTRNQEILEHIAEVAEI